MFTPASRLALREWLVDLAKSDPRVTAAAVMGSGAYGEEDRWSDIDLGLRLSPGEDPTVVADDWMHRLTARAPVVDHLDLWSRGALYRVFLFSDTLQVDISFWPDEAFAAYGPRFRLLFGDAPDIREAPAVDPPTLLGMAWVHALHVRSSLARGRVLQAVYMLNAVREHAIQLACLRHGLPLHEGRGVDDLPSTLAESFAASLPLSADPTDLRRAFARIVEVLGAEAEFILAEDSARQLKDVLAELVRTSDPTADS